jgi:hypothetical protein
LLRDKIKHHSTHFKKHRFFMKTPNHTDNQTVTTIWTLTSRFEKLCPCVTLLSCSPCATSN